MGNKFKVPKGYKPISRLFLSDGRMISPPELAKTRGWLGDPAKNNIFPKRQPDLLFGRIEKSGVLHIAGYFESRKKAKEIFWHATISTAYEIDWQSDEVG